MRLNAVRVTQKQVAELARVTQATVSYVLNGRAQELSITPPVVARVRQAARQLGYYPSHAARSLVSGRSRTLGLLLGGPDGHVAPFWSHIAEGVESEALKAGYDVLIVSGRREGEPAGLCYLRQRRVDALIALGATRDELEDWPEAALPPVVLSPEGIGGFPTVRLDVGTGYGEALARLAELGHRRVLWVGPPRGSCYGRDVVVAELARRGGVRAEIIHLEREEPPFWVPVEECIQFWRDALGAALPDPLPAAALLCWNDRAALGLYALLAGRGVRVPGDVSVVGFDDDEAALAQPPLSTVSQQYRETGAAATRLALRMVEGELSVGQARRTVARVASHYVPRHSVGPPPRTRRGGSEGPSCGPGSSAITLQQTGGGP